MDRAHTAFQWMYLLLSNGIEKALREPDGENCRAILREAQAQAETIYIRSGRRNDMMLDDRGRLCLVFDFDPLNEQIRKRKD